MQHLPVLPQVSPAGLAAARPPNHPPGRHRSHFPDGEIKAQQNLVTCQRLQLMSNLPPVQSQAPECSLSVPHP